MNKKLITVFASGLTIGLVAAGMTPAIKAVGTLRVDESDPDETPYLFLELDRSINVIRKSKYVLMKVVNKNYLPRKTQPLL
jgi:hypothetical protein